MFDVYLLWHQPPTIQNDENYDIIIYIQHFYTLHTKNIYDAMFSPLTVHFQHNFEERPYENRIRKRKKNWCALLDTA